MTLMALFAGCLSRTFYTLVSNLLNGRRCNAHLRLEVTVYDAMVPHEGQRQQHLAREAADESGREAHEAVRLDQLVEIDAQQLHGDTKVVAEIEMFSHLDNMVLFVMILWSL